MEELVNKLCEELKGGRGLTSLGSDVESLRSLVDRISGELEGELFDIHKYGQSIVDSLVNEDSNDGLVVSSKLKFLYAYDLIGETLDYSKVFSFFIKNNSKELDFLTKRILKGDYSGIVNESNGRILADIIKRGYYKIFDDILKSCPELVHCKLSYKKDCFDDEGISLLSYTILKANNDSMFKYNNDLKIKSLSSMFDTVNSVDAEVFKNSFGLNGVPLFLSKIFSPVNNDYYSCVEYLKLLNDKFDFYYTEKYKGHNIYDIVKLWLCRNGSLSFNDYLKANDLLLCKGNVRSMHDINFDKITVHDIEAIAEICLDRDRLARFDYILAKIEAAELLSHISSDRSEVSLRL